MFFTREQDASYLQMVVDKLFIRMRCHLQTLLNKGINC